LVACPTIQQLDRIFLQAYAPKLQSVGGVCRFLHWQKGLGIPPSAAFGKIGDAYVAKVDLWAKAGMVSRCAGSARGKTQRSRWQERAATGGWCYSGLRRKEPG